MVSISEYIHLVLVFFLFFSLGLNEYLFFFIFIFPSTPLVPCSDRWWRVIFLGKRSGVFFLGLRGGSGFGGFTKNQNGVYVKAESIHVCTRRKRGRSSVGMYGYWYEYERKEIDLWYACSSGETYIDVVGCSPPVFFFCL